jgi:hypothetical protein
VNELDMWPQVEPLTGRKVCQMCWNQAHRLCWNKPKEGDEQDALRPECHCACLDPKPARRRIKCLSMDIIEIYGRIEIT